MAEPSQGVVAIAVERDRQQDDGEPLPAEVGERAQAGAAYALAAYQQMRGAAGLPRHPWTPADPEDWWPGDKPPGFDGDPVELLRKAGALIAAEIDAHLAARQNRGGGVGGDPLVRARD